VDGIDGNMAMGGSFVYDSYCVECIAGIGRPKPDGCRLLAATGCVRAVNAGRATDTIGQ